MVNPKFVSEAVMRCLSDVTAQLISQRRVADPAGAIAFGAFGLLCTGPVNVWANGLVLKYGSRSPLLKIFLSNFVHLPAIVSLLLTYKIALSSVRQGHTPARAMQKALRGARLRLLPTLQRIWPTFILGIAAVQRWVPPAQQTYALQLFAFISTVITALQANAEANKQERIKQN